MRLAAQIKLVPTPEQAVAIGRTIETANAACNAISKIAWESKTFRQFDISRLVYHPIRAEYGLSANMTVRAIAKVAAAYKTNRTKPSRFYIRGAIRFDDRIMTINKRKMVVSLWTTRGRMKVPFVCDEKRLNMLDGKKGEALLALRNGAFYVLQPCEVLEPTPRESKGFIGVDVGVRNIAVTSDGDTMSGKQVNGLRRRHRALRKKLQKKCTRSAKRLLKKRSKKERLFSRDVNHCISKRIVAEAERTSRGIALEDLRGIRERIRAPRSQRAALHSWAFHQLRAFIDYKARLAGVEVVAVDPAYTSQTCPQCGNVDKHNRPSRDIFKCVVCGHSGPADHIAAENIRRAAVNRPNAACAVSQA